jgi:Spy/CpxP family protein refolding chaperone
MRGAIFTGIYETLTGINAGAFDNAAIAPAALSGLPAKSTTEPRYMKTGLGALLAAGAAVIIFPLSSLAHGPQAEGLRGCQAGLPHEKGAIPPQPHRTALGFAAAGPMNAPLFLHGVDLTEAQRDKLFELRHTQEPILREKTKAAAKAQLELRYQAHMESFDGARARSLADAHGKALADIAMMHAQFASQALAMLTPEQRKQLDERLARMELSAGHGDKRL